MAGTVFFVIAKIVVTHEQLKILLLAILLF